MKKAVFFSRFPGVISLRRGKRGGRSGQGINPQEILVRVHSGWDLEPFAAVKR